MTVYEASPALRISVEVRPSSLPGAGRGIFALDSAPAGAFLGMDFCNPKRITPEDQVLDLPPEIRMYSWRQIEHVCFAANPDHRAAADLMNHSFEPNIHWHLGHYFAAKEIQKDDELLLDYRHLLSPLWNNRLKDAATGQPVNGWEWRDAILDSCRTMIEILERTAPEKGK